MDTVAEMEHNSDIGDEGSGLELVQVSDVLNYLGEDVNIIEIIGHERNNLYLFQASLENLMSSV